MGNKYNGNLQTSRCDNHSFASGGNIASSIAIGLFITFAAFCTLYPAGSYAAETQQVPIRGAKNSTEQFSGAIYGPIDNNDTLWGIANRYRQNKNLSIYQVMVAIQELNPEAFSSGNLNDIKNGATLRLPSERYVARVDAQQAKLKADSDDDNWRVTAQAGTSLTNIKPPEKLASRSDLDSTKQQIESQLNRIDTEQQRQFEAIREQFKASIDSVQTLLDENRKIYNRLDDVNVEIEELRDRIGDEGEVQRQMDQILALQNELVDNARRQNALAESETDVLGAITSPMALILYSILLTSSLLIGLGMWLLKRQQQPAEQPDQELQNEPDAISTAELADVDSPVAEELAGETLTEVDSLFNDDELSDDDIDHTLDEVLENELDALDQIDEEMLATDSDDLEILGEDIDQVFSDASTGALVDPDTVALQEESPSADTDTDTDSDILNFTQELEEPVEESEQPSAPAEAPTAQEGPANDAEPTPAPAGDLPEELLAQDAEIDELAQPEEPEQPQELVKPEQRVADEESVLSKDELEKVNEKLAAQNRELNDLTLELSDELRSAPDKEPDDPEIAIEGAADETFGDEAGTGADVTENQVADDIAAELDSEAVPEQIASDEKAGSATPVLEPPAQAESTPVEADTPASNVAAVADDADFAKSAQDALADDLLAEFGVEPDAALSDTPEAESIQSDLADELLSEFGIEPSDTSVLDTPNLSDQEDLANELLADLDSLDPEQTQPTASAQDERLAQELSESDDPVDELAIDSELGDPDPVAATPAAQEMDAAPAEDEQPRKHYPIDDLSEEDYQALLSELADISVPAEPDGASPPTQLQTAGPMAEPEPSADLASANAAEEPPTLVGDADLQGAETANEPAAVAQETDQLDSSHSGSEDGQPVAAEPPSNTADSWPPAQPSNVGEQLSGQTEAAPSVDVSMLESDLNDVPEFGDWLLDSTEAAPETSVTASDVELVDVPSQEKTPSQPSRAEKTADIQEQRPNEPVQQPATAASPPTSASLTSQQGAAELPVLDDLALSLDYFTDDDDTAKAVADEPVPEASAASVTAEHDDLSSLAEMLSETSGTPVAAELSDALADPLGEVTATDDLLQHIENSTFEELLNSIDDDGEEPLHDTVAEQPPNRAPQHSSEPDYEAELAASADDFFDDAQERRGENVATVEEVMPLAEAQVTTSAQRPQEEAAVFADSTDNNIDNIDIAALLRDVPDDDAATAAADTDKRPDFNQDEAVTETFLRDDIDDSEPLTGSADTILPDNPDLDLDALLSDKPSMDDLDISDEELLAQDAAVGAMAADDDFTDVDTLLAESLKAEGEELQERDLNLDSVLGDVTAAGSDRESVDVDADGDVSAKLNLARAYLEISENDLAQQLLREVLESGTTAERAEARDLLVELRGA